MWQWSSTNGPASGPHTSRTRRELQPSVYSSWPTTSSRAVYRQTPTQPIPLHHYLPTTLQRTGYFCGSLYYTGCDPQLSKRNVRVAQSVGAKWTVNNFSHGNILKVWRKILRSFIGNFIAFSAVKEFWKSAKIWESYCQKFGGFLFWNTMYIQGGPKNAHYTLVHIFAKYWPIFIILSPTHSVKNSQ